MSEAENKLRRALEERVARDSLRELTTPDGLVDFCSNDYLGFSRSDELKQRIREEEGRHDSAGVGSTGSRLISGNSRYCEDLERMIASFHKSGSALIFNSGYDANTGLFSSVLQRNDVILYDKLVHASIRDGIRLSHAKAFSFGHNAVDELESKLKSELESRQRPGNGGGSIFVGVESVYSMDGDCAPLDTIAGLCEQYDAGLIVDEAHATGVFGKNGEGKVVELGLQESVFARVHTFGKALGSHGAAVLGSESLRSYLVNFARSFIYTTALPFHSLASIRCAYELLMSDDKPIRKLRENVALFRKKLAPDLDSGMIESGSAIQCRLIQGNTAAKKLALEIRSAGLDVRAILHPTVPAGTERIRMCLHAFNTEDEIAKLTNKLRTSKS